MFKERLQFKISCTSWEVSCQEGSQSDQKFSQASQPKVIKTALSTGADLMSGKDVKKTLKKGLRESAGAIASRSRDVLLDEVSHLKGNADLQGSRYLMQTGRKSTVTSPITYLLIKRVDEKELIETGYPIF